MLTRWESTLPMLFLHWQYRLCPDMMSPLSWEVSLLRRLGSRLRLLAVLYIAATNRGTIINSIAALTGSDKVEPDPVKFSSCALWTISSLSIGEKGLVYLLVGTVFVDFIEKGGRDTPSSDGNHFHRWTGCYCSLHIAPVRGTISACSSCYNGDSRGS